MMRLLLRPHALRLATLVLVAGCLYAMLPSAQALIGPSGKRVPATQEAPPALGVAQAFIALAPEPSAWIATLCGVGLLVGLRRFRRAA